MTIKDLSEYIVRHKDGKMPYPYGDDFIVLHHLRNVLFDHIHITNEHVLECCALAKTYEEFIDLCRPIAKSDTEQWNSQKNKPIQKGRTRRRFR